MNLLTILGARPQFIKAGAVSRKIKKFNNISNNKGEKIKEVIVHTGQHYDFNMSDVFFEELHLPKPDYFLGINGLNHGAMTGQMMEKIEDVALKEKPDVILVYGDTNSTLAGALVGSKLYIPVAHIEAGLRSFNMQMPEEINRILTDRVSKWLFCPTETAVNNLKKEGFPFKYIDSKNQIIENVGDVMYDAAMYYKQFAKPPKIALSTKQAALSNKIKEKKLNTYNLTLNSDFILCTIHRAENTDNPERLKNIFEALEEIAKEIPVVLPLHPRTRKKLDNLALNAYRLTLIDPVGYLEMIWLLDHCKLVITDSGGLQKEAYFFNKFCITLRDETEWVELVDSGFNVLVGANKERIVKSFKNNIEISINNTNLMLYGDGKASLKIIKGLMR